MEKGKHNTKKTAQRVNEDKSSGSARKNGNPDNNKPRRNAHAGINYIQEQVMNNVLRGILAVIYGLLFVWILTLIFGMQGVLNVLTEKGFPLKNIIFIIIGCCGIALLFWMNIHYGHRIEVFLQKWHRAILWISLGILFTWQVYSCYGGYFQSGWDAGIIRNTVGLEYSGNYAQISNGYFSWFPNNKLLVWLFQEIARFAAFIGYSNWEFSLVIFQCILDAASIYLVYRVAIHCVRNQRLAFLIFFTAYLFVGISPWFIVAYSDATGFLFPILSVRLYQRVNESKHQTKGIIWGLLLGFVSMAGFYIKPQVFIVFIAFLLTDICCLIGKDFKNRLPAFLKDAICYAAGIIIFLSSYNGMIVPQLHFQTDPDSTIGWQHYLMMGLNVSRDGVYSDEDYYFTRSFSTNQERNHADLQEAKNRITEMGAGGLFRHLSRKQFVNYGDGTFGWAVEGNSFAGDPEWAQNGISETIRSLIKPEGKNYDWFISSKQLIWVVILFFQLFVFLYRRKALSGDAERCIVAMAISVIGLTIFELLFEARARYLFCYAPIYVILSGWGLRNVNCLIRKVMVRKKMLQMRKR